MHTCGEQAHYMHICNCIRLESSLRQVFATPGVVQGLTVTAIATGRCTTLAVGPGGTVYSWGCGNLGRPGSHDTPTAVPGFGANETAGRAWRVAASEYTSVVITETGQVRNPQINKVYTTSVQPLL